MSVLPTRSGSRLAVLAALLAATLFLPPVVVRYALPALSPFVWLCTLLAAHALGLGFLCGIPMLAFVLWRRRGFCHFLCPMGWMVELCAKTRPSADCSYSRVPLIGQWTALVTAGGAIVSVPVFLLLDPVSIFMGAAGAAQMPVVPSRLAYAGLFAFVLVLSLVFPFLWCRKLCPLGASQDLLAESKHFLVRRLRGGGGVEAIAENNATTSREAHADLRLARRAFIGVSGGMALSALAVRAPREGVEGRLRPPGSVGETEFSAMCIRCGNCVRSCPTNIIDADLHPPKVTSLLTPKLQFDTDHCLETCNACGQNCPTGAIAALPIAEKNERKIGLARIEQEGCLLAIEKECSVCALICKREAIVEEFSRETYTAIVRVDAERCNGCGACVAVCPPRVVEVVPQIPSRDRNL